jgi:hypothetical protein
MLARLEGRCWGEELGGGGMCDFQAVRVAGTHDSESRVTF